jgi:hypothetical protein
VSIPIWGSWPDIYCCFDSYGLVFCGAPSLTRGRVCLLGTLLALASAVFLRSESLGVRDHILLSQIWDFPVFLLPHTTRRVTVEVFDPASTRVWTDQINCLQDNFPARTTSETQFFYCCARVHLRRNVFTEPLLTNGSVRHSTFIYLLYFAVKLCSSKLDNFKSSTVHLDLCC